MIQAQNPSALPNNNSPQNVVVTKVHGFSKPKNPTTTTHTQKKSPSEKRLMAHVYHWWHKIAIVLLAFHGLFGIWESVYFMAVDYPKLNELLKLHVVETTEVNHLLAKAIISTMVTVVNILFAVRLSQEKETTAHNIDLLVATFLIITTSFIREFLYQLDLLNLLFSYF